MLKPQVLIFPLALVLAAATSASAQPATAVPESDPQLEQLIEEAKALLGNLQALHRAGKPVPKEDAKRALELSERADAIQSSARTMTFRASAEQWLGRWGASEEHFSTALSREDDAYVASARAFIERGLADVRGHMGELVITGPAGASVWVKDSYKARTRGVLPLKTSVWVTPGSISIQVAAAGYQQYRLPRDGETLSIEAGERLPIHAAPVKATLVEIAPLPSDAGQRDGVRTGSSRWPAWLLIGVGASAVAGGAVYGIATSSGCGTIPPGAICHETARNPWIARGLPLAGIVTAAVGGVLLYRARDSEISVAVGPGTFTLGGRL
jgi:hypothetical protein